MLGVVFAVLVVLSCVYGAIGGNLPALSQAALNGAGRAVELTLSLCGVTALFGGVMNLFAAAGVSERFARLLRPLLCRLFPGAERGGYLPDVGACVAANLFGMGNAATPLALRAMEKMEKAGSQPGVATDDMITLAVMNTVPATFLPAGIIALRQGGGSAAAAAVVLPVLLVSVCGAAFGVSLARLCARLFPYSTTKRKERQAENAGNSVRRGPAPPPAGGGDPASDLTPPGRPL